MTDIVVLVGVLLVYGVIFYRVAESDKRSGLLWMTISIAVGAAVRGVLGWCYLGLAFAQLLVLVAMFGMNWYRRDDEW